MTQQIAATGKSPMPYHAAMTPAISETMPETVSDSYEEEMIDTLPGELETDGFEETGYYAAVRV